MDTKNFRVDWNFRDSYMDFARLEAEETGVLMQIINLIYHYGGEIDNDPQHIGKSCNLRPTKCAKVISSLLNKGEIYLTDQGKIRKKRCDIALRDIQNRREISAKNGKKGSETRWKIQQKQGGTDSYSFFEAMASTNISTDNRTINNTSEDMYSPMKENEREGGYDIESQLTEADISAIRVIYPNLDFQSAMNVYNKHINDNVQKRPKNAGAAFFVWIRKEYS